MAAWQLRPESEYIIPLQFGGLHTCGTVPERVPAPSHATQPSILFLSTQFVIAGWHVPLASYQSIPGQSHELGLLPVREPPLRQEVQLGVPETEIQTPHPGMSLKHDLTTLEASR